MKKKSLTYISKSLMNSIIFLRPKMLSKTFPYIFQGRMGRDGIIGGKFDIGM